MVKELLLLYGTCFLLKKTMPIVNCLNFLVYNIVVSPVTQAFALCGALLSSVQ